MAPAASKRRCAGKATARKCGWKVGGPGAKGVLPRHGRMNNGIVYEEGRDVVKAETVPIRLRQVTEAELSKVGLHRKMGDIVPLGSTIIVPRFCNVRCAPVTQRASPVLTRRGADDFPQQLRHNVDFLRMCQETGREPPSETTVVTPTVAKLGGLPKGWTDAARSLPEQAE